MSPSKKRCSAKHQSVNNLVNTLFHLHFTCWFITQRFWVRYVHRTALYNFSLRVYRAWAIRLRFIFIFDGDFLELWRPSMQNDVLSEAFRVIAQLEDYINFVVDSVDVLRVFRLWLRFERLYSWLSVWLVGLLRDGDLELVEPHRYLTVVALFNWHIWVIWTVSWGQWRRWLDGTEKRLLHGLHLHLLPLRGSFFVAVPLKDRDRGHQPLRSHVFAVRQWSWRQWFHQLFLLLTFQFACWHWAVKSRWRNRRWHIFVGMVEQARSQRRWLRVEPELLRIIFAHTYHAFPLTFLHVQLLFYHVCVNHPSWLGLGDDWWRRLRDFRRLRFFFYFDLDRGN